MDPVSIILGLGQFVPGLLRWLNQDGAAEVAEKAVAVGRTLTGKESAEDVIAALKANPQLAVEFQRAGNDLVIAEMENETKRLQAVNETMRAEYSSGDPYVRRARPTFLYAMALTWTIQALGLLLGAIAKPELAAEIIQAAADLTTMWGVALTVVGVAVKSRSDDKARALGFEAPSVFDALARRLGKK